MILPEQLLLQPNDLAVELQRMIIVATSRIDSGNIMQLKKSKRVDVRDKEMGKSSGPSYCSSNLP